MPNDPSTKDADCGRLPSQNGSEIKNDVKSESGSTPSRSGLAGKSSSAESALDDAFELEKWVGELKVRQQELELRREELSIKKQDGRRLDDELNFKINDATRSRWRNPLVIAIIGAALAASGNALVAWLNGRNQESVEQERAESERILTAIRTDNPDKAAINLKFLVDAGLITNSLTASYISKYVNTRKSGEGPALPAVDRLLPSLESQDSIARHEARKQLALLGAAAIPKITELLANNRNSATASYRLVLGAIEVLAEMQQGERCEAYKKNPALLHDVSVHAGINDGTLDRAARRALVCG